VSKKPELEVQTEQQGPCLHLLHLQAPPARVGREFRHFWQDVGRRVRIPGFRPGHVPPEILRRRLGEEMEKEAREHVVEHLVRDAMKRSGLRVLRLLDFDPAGVEVEEGEPLALELKMETWPEIELPPWEEVRVAAEPVAAGDDEVEETIRGMARDHARFDPEPDAVLDEEHLVVCDLRYHRDGEEGPGAEGLRLGLSAPLYGCDAEAFRTAMAGARAGQEIRVPIRFLAGFEREDWVGSEGEAALQVREVVRPRPATEEELVEELGLESADELRARIREEITRHKESRERDRRLSEMLETMSRLRPFDLPARLVEEEIDAGVEAQRKRLREQGLDETQAAARAEEAREQIAEAARRRLRAFFLTRRIAEAEHLAVTRQDMQRAYEALAGRHQVDPGAVAAYYKERGLTGQLHDDILDSKVRAFLAARLAAQDAGTEEAAAGVAADVAPEEGPR